MSDVQFENQVIIPSSNYGQVRKGLIGLLLKMGVKDEAHANLILLGTAVVAIIATVLVVIHLISPKSNPASASINLGNTIDQSQFTQPN